MSCHTTGPPVRYLAGTCVQGRELGKCPTKQKRVIQTHKKNARIKSNHECSYGKVLETIKKLTFVTFRVRKAGQWSTSVWD